MERAESERVRCHFRLISSPVAAAPGEMVGQFMSTAPPRVQIAVKNTVLGLLGSLRASPAFDSNIVTTQRALASLMFQLGMTVIMPTLFSLSLSPCVCVCAWVGGWVGLLCWSTCMTCTRAGMRVCTDTFTLLFKIQDYSYNTFGLLLKI